MTEQFAYDTDRLEFFVIAGAAALIAFIIIREFTR